MHNFSGKFEELWWKVLLGILMIVSPLVVIGYLYKENNSCGKAVWDCLEIEMIIFGGGLLAISLPLFIILIGWEVYKLFKKNGKEETTEDKIEGR